MDDGKKTRSEPHCSFCGGAAGPMKRLLAGPNGVHICNACADACKEVFDRAKAEESARSKPLFKLSRPAEICAHLDRYVVGQDRAKKTLSVAVYNHYKRLALALRGSEKTKDGADAADDVEVEKSNILLIGPTGTGKTLLARALARLLDVPFAIADATTLTEAGYVGEDVENIVLRLIQAADYDIARAQCGIIYVDEIDKIARKTDNVSISRDVSGEGVQQALLKIVEGTQCNVPPKGGRKHPDQAYIKIDTSNILFICGGAFVGLDKIVAAREDNRRLGFAPETAEGGEAGALSGVQPEDLVKFGMIPEFVGRLPVTTTLDPLTRDDLVRILTQPKNALVKQYAKLLAMEGAELVVEPEAAAAIADRALALKTGARALRAIMENLMLDVMYELPQEKNVAKVVLTAKCVRDNAPPKIVRK